MNLFTLAGPALQPAMAMMLVKNKWNRLMRRDPTPLYTDHLFVERLARMAAVLH